MSHFRGARQNLNFDKEYLFGFETLVLATSVEIKITTENTLTHDRSKQSPADDSLM